MFEREIKVQAEMASRRPASAVSGIFERKS